MPNATPDSNMKAPRSKHVSLKTAIVAPLVMLFGAAILIQSLTQHQTVRRMVDDEHAQRLVEATRSVQARLAHFLAAPVMAQRMLVDAVHPLGQNAVSDPVHLADRVASLFDIVRSDAPQISAIGFGGANGLYIGVRNNNGGDAPNLMHADPGQDGAQLRIHAGNSLASAVQQTFQGYDPRTRPWYLSGTAHRSPRWTASYTNADERRQVALSYAGAVLHDGVVVGVAATDITLDGLNDYLGTVRDSFGGMIAIVDGDDNLVAQSHPAGVRELGTMLDTPIVPSRLADSADPLLRETSRVLAAIASNRPGRFAFVHDDEAYQAYVEPFAPTSDLHWRIVALLPESAALSQLRHEQLLGLVTTLTLGFGALLGGLWLIGRLTRPIVDSIDTVSSLALGDEPRPPPPSRHPVRETVMLSDALTAMSQRMNGSFDRLRQAVMLDNETGLPTLHGLREKVCWPQPKTCVLFVIGIDSLPMIDALLGTQTGTQLALAIAGRLRSISPEALMIARIERATFVVLHDAQLAMESHPPEGQRLLDAFDAPFELPRDTLVARVSIGSLSGPLDASVLDEWVDNASATMRIARTRGGGIHLHASDEINESAHMCQALCEALAHSDLTTALITHYQPIVSLNAGEVIAIEALTRWEHPQLGLLGPESFISASETSALAIEIGRHMLKRACTDAMRHFRATGQHIEVHVNLSARQVLQSNFLDLVLTTLHESRLPPRQLVLELRESLLGGALDAGIDDLIRSLRAIGVKTAIDEFGRGQSAIGRLSELPVNYVKLDRSLVRELSEGNSRASALTATIIDFADKLGLECIAVGVESRMALGILRRLGCVSAQGFLFGDPCPFRELNFKRHDSADSVRVEPLQKQWADGGSGLHNIRPATAPDAP